jgi:hypothetical protein
MRMRNEANITKQQMTETATHLSIVRLNVNGLHSLIKR